jgi:hypothetical protein
VAGGDGLAKVIHMTVPEELHQIVILYQNRRRLVSISAAVRELLETHPAIDSIVQGLYNGTNTLPVEGGCSSDSSCG